MASNNNIASITSLLITFNLLFFTLVSSYVPPLPTLPPKKGLAPAMPPAITQSPATPPSTTASPPMPPAETTSPAMPPSTIESPGMSPSTTESPGIDPANEACPIDVLKLGVCVNLLNDLVHLIIGTPTTSPCCTLIGGLADLDAAVCLCTAINANVLGINLNVPISLSLLLNNCGKDAPSSFVCE